MKINDLLTLLREEFALDIPMTQQAMQAAAQEPDQAAAHLEPMIGYIERSMQASELMSLHGWGQYLSQISQFAQLQMMAPQVESLEWLTHWITPALAYLDAPAIEPSAQGIIEYLSACPQPTDHSALAQLHALLMQPPQLAADEAAAAEASVEPATEADISLQTDEVDGGLLSAMLQDAPEQLETLHQYLSELAKGDIQPTHMIEAQRIAHTFKGSGNIIGLPGIGKISHRLEDVMEWTIECNQSGEKINTAAVRDMLHAVDVLMHMVAHLQGEEVAPGSALVCLQRLIDWVNWIRRDEAAEQMPEALSNTTQLIADPAVSADENEKSGTVNAPADAQTLRVGVDRLSRVLRRSTQSIVASQRVGQLVRVANDHLAEIEIRHAELARRLRELEQAVDKQVVQLRGQKEQGQDFDPLEMDRYDALYMLSRSVSEAVQDELELSQEARSRVNNAAQILRNEEQVHREQHRDLLAARLVPVKTILARLKRNVAQTAATTGKQAQLLVEGESTTLDADVLTRLTEPLLHLLRNAVDHGLESTEERKLLRKPLTGMVTLSFRRVGQEIEFVCADDGKGLDLPIIYDKALEYGLIEKGTELSEAEIRRLILRPGFSTKGEVTEVSGRGVGMDVVNDRVTGLKGRLEIESTPMMGSRFIVRVPVSTGAMQALIVRCANEEIALASDQIIQALAADEVEIVDGDSVAKLKHLNQEYRIYSLSEWLGLEEQQEIVSKNRPAVLVNGLTQPIALQVDGVVDARELILQEVGRLTRRISGIVGAALRHDGRPMFLLDVIELERAALAARSGVKKVGISLALRRRLAVQKTKVLVVDDALSVRRSMQQLLEDAGYEVSTAADGFLAMEQIRQKPPAIVLTDLEMPNLNGIDLTKRLRELPQFMSLPIVMITSRASDKHRELAELAGVDLYLTKPYTDAVLIEHIKRLNVGSATVLI